jgi:hypothetical protein
MSRSILIAALLLPGADAATQESAAWRDSTIRAAAELRALRDSMQQAETRLAEVGRHSNLVLSASPGVGAATVETLLRFDETRRRWFGIALPAPSGFRITITGTSSSGRQRSRSLSVTGLPGLEGAPRASPRMRDRELEDTEVVVRELLFHYGQMMMAGTGSMVRWLPTLPLNIPDQSRREQAMYVLVTGVGRAQRGCTTGNTADCAYALGLRSSEYQDPGGQYAPLARADLLLAALELGGESAWDRLRLAPDTGVEARLVSAANLPVDSLIARWRRDLLRLRPDRTPVRAANVAMLIVWSATAGLAAMAAARWR